MLVVLLAAIASVALAASSTADQRNSDPVTGGTVIHQDGNVLDYYVDRYTYHVYLFLESSDLSPEGWNWDDAIQEATNPDYAFADATGHLATISTWQEFEVVTSFGPENCFWLAAHDVDPKNHERDIHFAAGPEDDSNVEFLDPLQDEALDKSLRCLLLDSTHDHYYFSDCSETKAILIEFECPGGQIFNFYGFNPDKPEFTCVDSGWYNEDRTHYYEVRPSYLDWGDNIEISGAYEYKCRKGHVATITSQDEDDLVYEGLDWWYSDNEWYLVWIAANDIATARLEATGGEGLFVWSDGPDRGQEVAFADWAHNQPEQNPTKACVQAEPNGWHTKTCAASRDVLLEYECPEGYYFGEECCEVINQCSINNGGCGDNSQCLKNSGGPYFCRCNAGYISTNDPRDGKACEAIDLCTRPDPFAGHNTCGQNSDCWVVGGNADHVGGVINCKCHDGFVSHTGDGRYCLPVHSCDDNNGGCGDNSVCTNPTPLTVTCSCVSGYHSRNTPANGRDCAPIDICSVHPHVCGSHSICTSTGPGTYSCECALGFVTDNPDGKNCVKVTTPDIDPQPYATQAP